MFKRGDWVPGNFPPLVTLIAQMVLFGTMMVRGTDYLLGDGPRAGSLLTTVEAAAPIHWWGLACLTGSLLGFGGMLVRKTWAVLYGHLVGAAIYSALSVGIVVDVWKRSTDPDASLVVAAALVFIATGLLLSIRTGLRDKCGLIIIIGFLYAVALAVSSMGLDGIRTGGNLLGMAVLHMLMAIGIASRHRQKLLMEREGC